MKRIRIIATLATMAGAALILSGCATGTGSAGSTTIDVTNAKTVAALCGPDAVQTDNAFTELANATSDSGQRHMLTKWGIDDPSNDKVVAKYQTALDERAKVKCDTDGSSPSASPSAPAAADKTTKTDWNKYAKELNAAKATATNTCDVSKVIYAGKKGIDFKPEFLQSHTDHLKYADSYASAFASTDPVAARKELMEANCFDTVQGVTNATGLATDVSPKLKSASGGVVDLIALNPWLKEFTNPDNISTLAEKYDPLEFDSNITGQELQHAYEMNQQWQVIASKLNYLYTRYDVAWADSPKSLVNYHDVTRGQAGSAFPSIKKNDKQENLKALTFTLQDKGVCDEIVKFGANAFDKRFELFAAKDCTPVPTPSKPATPSTPGKPSTPGTPGTPTTPHTTTNPCPPGNTIPSCSPKSHNAKDYTYPSGKPKATVTGPADKAPPAVTTTKPGGGGVTDTPTKPAGSETGGKAPGATPAPTTKATPPPNQGGDNGAGDPSGF